MGAIKHEWEAQQQALSDLCDRLELDVDDRWAASSVFESLSSEAMEKILAVVDEDLNDGKPKRGTSPEPENRKTKSNGGAHAR